MADEPISMKDPIEAAATAFTLVDTVIATIKTAHDTVMELDIEVANETGVHPLKRVRGPVWVESYFGNGNVGPYYKPEQKLPPLNSSHAIPPGYADAMSYDLLGGVFRDGLKGFVVYSVGDLAWFCVAWSLWHRNPEVSRFALLTGGTHSLYLGGDKEHEGFIVDDDLLSAFSDVGWPNGLAIIYDSDGKQVPGGTYKYGEGNGDGASITHQGPLLQKQGTWGAEVSMTRSDNHYTLRCVAFKGSTPPSVKGFLDNPPST